MRWALLLLIPLASGQMLTDPAGDVEVSSYSQSAGAPPIWQAVDLRALHIEETPDALLFTVDIEGLPNCEAGQCANAGDLRTFFEYGGLYYYTQQGITPLGFAYGQLHSVEPGGIDGPAIAVNLAATVDREASTVTATVPRDLIVDASGGPLVKGNTLTDIFTRSYSQFSLGGPEVDGESDMLVTRDRMGFDAPGSLTLQYGGNEHEGAVEAGSIAPYRASNGGAATYLFEIWVAATDAVELELSIEGLPAGWAFQRPNGTLSMAAGDNVTFPIIIETPSGHQHGGTDRFSLLLMDGDDWARVDLGIHYLAVPQPAGHHPTLYFHSLSDGAVATLGAVFGGDGGRIWMNTLEEDPGDQGVAVVGREGFDGFTGQRTQWSICLMPNLRLGIDMDLARTGELEFPISAVGAHTGVSLTGRLLHIEGGEPLNFCDPFAYAGRKATEIATMASVETADLLASTTTFTMEVEPLAAGELIPYEAGAQLVLELEATFTGGDPGPGGLSMEPGGAIRLPLLEYSDGRPAGLVGDSVSTDGELADFEEAPTASKDSPGPALVVALATALWIRRR